MAYYDEEDFHSTEAVQRRIRANKAKADAEARANESQKLPGMSEREEFATALGRDLGFEQSKYKGVPIYEDPNGDGKPVRKGERGPGIYVPEGGAFSGAGLKFDTDQKVNDTDFDTPQEALRKKFEPRLSKMSADEKEMMYRKARGMEIPRGLQARRDVAGLNEEIDAWESALKGLPGGGSTTPKPTGGSRFVDGVLKDLGGGDNALEMAAASAPAVAFNGRGPLAPAPKMPGASALMQTENAGGNAGGLGGSLRERILAQKFGLKWEDPAERARKDEERQWAREDRTAKQRQMELDTKLKEFQVNQAMMSPKQRAAEALEIAKIQKELADAQKTPTQKLKEQMEAEGLERERTGALSPREEKQAIAAAAIDAKNRAKELSQTMPWEEAQAAALEEQNAKLAVLGVKTPLAPSFLSASKPAIDTRPAALMQKAYAAKLPDTTTAYKQALSNIVRNDPSLKTFLGRGLNDADDKFLFQRSPINDPDYQRKVQRQVEMELTKLGYAPEQARALIEMEMTR